MHTRKALWLGSLALAMLTTPGWAQDRGQAVAKGNAFAPVQKQRAHVAPVTDADPDRRQPAADSAQLASDYRHHSLEQDADRVHQRRQHHRDAAAGHARGNASSDHDSR
jgi:hypothetical protein